MPTKPAGEHDELLKEIRERYDYASAEWEKIREEASKDMRYIAGDAWEPEERKAREAAGRPCISLDEINQYTNQVINQLRAKRRGATFSANGGGASEKTAEFYQEKWREIEYRSKAQIAYTTAVQNAVERGYGFLRVKTKLIGDRTRNQELWIEEIVNPDTVLPDPDAKRPTFSDMAYLFNHEQRKKEEFKREFPDARIQSFTKAHYELAPGWLKDDELTIAEYWKVKMRKRVLVFAPGEVEGTYEDEAAAQGIKLQKNWERLKVEEPSVCMYLTNGVEILEPEVKWPGKYIPFVACVGKVIYLNKGAGTERVLMSMTRLMRDPQMLNAYLRTNEAELVGMTPKTPYIGYTGQFETRKEDWVSLNHTPKPFIEADGKTEATGDQLLPLPMRAPYEPPIQALEILAESSRRSIQAAAGSNPLPTSAQRRNEKSGKALEKMDEVAQVGSYHIADHYDDTIEHTAAIGEDLMDKILDTKREVAVRTSQNKAAMRVINDPADPQAVSTKGNHLVTIDAGPSFDSTREAVKDLANTLLTGPDPEMTRAVMPEVIGMMELGAQGEGLIQIAEALQPPQIRAMKSQDGKPLDPKRLMMELQQAKQQIQHAEQAMQGLAKEAEGKQLDAQTKKEVAMIGAEKDKHIAARNNATELEKVDREIAARIYIAEVAARTKGVEMEHEREHEATAMAHEAATGAVDRAHEFGMAQEEALEAERGRAHEQGMAQAGQAHEVALTGAQADVDAEQAEAGRAHEAALSQAQLDAQAEQAAAAAASQEGA